MGGKSGDQVTGYQYFTNLVVMIGNRIEELIAINFDKRGWIINDEQKSDPRFKMEDDATYNFTYPDIYGKDEGGVVGAIGLRLGNPSPEVDPTYAAYLQSKEFPALAYPYLSYLVFKGKNEEGFYVGNNPFLKEMMLWPKRTRTRNDGRIQWYETQTTENGITKIVCEIDAYMQTITSPDIGSRVNRLQQSGYESIYFPDAGGLYTANIPLTPITSYTSREDTSLFDSLPKSGQYEVVEWRGSSVGGGRVMWFEKSTNVFVKSPGQVTLKFKFRVTSEYKITTTSTGQIINEYSEVVNTATRSANIAWVGPVSVIEREIEYTIVVASNAPFDVSFLLHAECQLVGHTKPPAAYIEYFYIDATYKALVRFDPYVEQDIIEIRGYDINPIHKIREILTDDTAMNISELEMNDEKFRRAALQIYDEGLGISTAFTEKNCKEALDEICSHIEAGVRVNRQTGKYEVILFRDNWYDLGNALHFDQSNIKRGSFNVEVMNTDDAINVLNVNYYDRDNIKDSSFNVYENGLIQTMGRENAETVDFPYFMNQRNAEVVANWKLKQLSTPVWKGSFSTSHRAARKLNRYDIITVTWPSKQIYDMPMRVMKINLGTATDTAVTIDFVEVVPYSNELISSIVVDPPVSVTLPPQQTNLATFEVPYYTLVQLFGQREADARLTYNPELGYLGVSALKPQSNSLNALLYTDGGTGDYLQFQKVGVVDYSSGVYLDQAISQLDTAFAVTDLDYVRNGAPKFTDVQLGKIGQINGELISFVEYDSETKILTVKRGVLDSVPTKHTSGLIHFWGESFAYDSNEYVIGETVAAQVLTTTPGGIEAQDPTKVKEVEMNARAIRPYPPANVKFNDAYYPEALIISNDIVLTWVDRNRVQQTGGEIISYFDAGVTVEGGVTYAYELSSEGVVLDSASSIAANTATILASVLIQNKPHTLKLWSTRDGYDSYQIFEHSFFVEAI